MAMVGMVGMVALVALVVLVAQRMSVLLVVFAVVVFVVVNLVSKQELNWPRLVWVRWRVVLVVVQLLDETCTKKFCPPVVWRTFYPLQSVVP